MSAPLRIQPAGFARKATPAADAARYAAIASDDGRTLERRVEVPATKGAAFSVARGKVLRITCHVGPQVCDFNAFAADDPIEHFWSGRTRTIEGAHLGVGARLWSTEPRMRPMFTLIADTVPHPSLPCNADSHDLVFARCSASAWALRYGPGDHANCNDNLVAALASLGHPTDRVHDAFNIFMTTGVDAEQRLVILDPQARRGDYVELFAEIDATVALSACPGDCNGGENKPLLAEVFAPSPTAMPADDGGLPAD